jgi:multiple antibiotic resistance protein
MIAVEILMSLSGRGCIGDIRSPSSRGVYKEGGPIYSPKGISMDPNGLFLYFVYAFTTIFVIVNPVEATLVYVTLTASCSAAEKSRINRRTTTVAFAIAILFALGGDAILDIFGITVDSLRVAGGILLFLVAIDMLRGVRQQKKVTEAELMDANERDDVSIFPLAIPLLTGPGAITTVVVLMGAAETVGEKALVLLAIALTFLATFFILKFSEYIDQALGITGIMVMTRIMGLILGAVAVNFVAAGTWNLYRSMALSGT